MKPRFSEAPLLIKARELEQRINQLELMKAKDCPTCKDGKLDKAGMCMKAGCMPSHKMAKADMATKDKYCMKNFGKKYSECSAKEKAQCDKVHGKVEKGEKCPSCGDKMEKGGCMKMGCGGKMAKAQPGYKPEKITDVNPAFMAESGGQTKSGYFTTNGKTIETEDVPKKKKGKDATNMEQLSTRMNPHAGGGVDREDRMGERKQ
tara:strand:+ start:1104 stop:1718 length:615 start_codon:yes stop_codon:yes gene_type:complete